LTNDRSSITGRATRNMAAVSAPATGLTSEQLEAFHRDGFLVVPGFLDEETMEALRCVGGARGIRSLNTVLQGASRGDCVCLRRFRSQHL
jgi:hypothetical protein